jgi:hypothetical protein
MSLTAAYTSAPPAVLSSSEARVSLATVLDGFRDHGLSAEPVFFGNHRRAEGVIIPVELFYALLPAIDELMLKETISARIAEGAESLDLDAKLAESLGLDPDEFNL